MEITGFAALTDQANESYVAWGVSLVSGAESTVELPVPAAGTLSDLHVRVDTAAGTGASWSLTVDKNGTPTVLNCSIGGDATFCGDASLLAVVAGDTVDLRVTPFGAPALSTITWSARLTP